MIHKDNLIHREIPILTYHRVVKTAVENSIFNIYITKDKLEQQIKYFLKRGRELVTFKDLQQRFVKKPLILTFDDGYQDNYQNLLPLLKKYNSKAVIFVLANRELTYNKWDVKKGEVKANLMSDNEIIKCHKSGYIEIASHGLNHKHLTKISDNELNKEIIESKQILEKIIADEIVSFAYPYGDYDDKVRIVVKNSGYNFGIATVQGDSCFKNDLFAIKRIPIFPTESKLSLFKKSSGYYLKYQKLKHKIRLLH